MILLKHPPFCRFLSACAAGLGLLLFAALSMQRAEARLGENEEEIAKRYGEPLRETKPMVRASDSAVIYVKDLVEVTVEFKNDIAWLVSYRTTTMTSDREAQFRDANDGVPGGVGDWKDTLKHLGRTYWVTPDKGIYAVRFDTGSSKIFRFMTSECKEAMGAERKEKVRNAKPGDIALEGEEAETGF